MSQIWRNNLNLHMWLLQVSWAVTLYCATLLTIDAHQDLYSPLSLVTHQKAPMFLFQSAISRKSVAGDRSYSYFLPVLLSLSFSFCSLTREGKDLQEIRSWSMDQNELWAVKCIYATFLERRPIPVISSPKKKADKKYLGSAYRKNTYITKCLCRGEAPVVSIWGEKFFLKYKF
jgi:hypothetical protein